MTQPSDRFDAPEQVLSARQRLGRGALALLAAGLLLVAGMTAVMVDSAESDVAAGSFDEPAAFAADANISKASARRALEDQRIASSLDDTLRRRLGAVYGGLWIARGTVTTIGVDSAPRAVLGTRIEGLARDAGIEGPVEIAWSHPSIEALEGRQRAMERDFAAINGDGRWINVEVDLPRGRVLVTPPKRPSGAQRDYLAALPTNIEGVRVDVGDPVESSFAVRASATTPANP